MQLSCSQPLYYRGYSGYSHSQSIVKLKFDCGRGFFFFFPKNLYRIRGLQAAAATKLYKSSCKTTLLRYGITGSQTGLHHFAAFGKIVVSTWRHAPTASQWLVVVLTVFAPVKNYFQNSLNFYTQNTQNTTELYCTTHPKMPLPLAWIILIRTVRNGVSPMKTSESTGSTK